MTDTPRTPRALPTHEQIVAALESDPRDRDWETALYARRVLTLIDKENTMPDEPSVSIPVDALRNIAARIHDGDGSNAAHDLLSWIHEPVDPPKPPAPRLRVVNLDNLRSNVEAYQFDWEPYMAVLEAQPDVLATVYQVIEEACGPTDITDVLKTRIRATLGAS